VGDVDLVVHGHFYQPPRENPWTEAVPVEPSAAPYHDWNERITDECYRPNGWARVVDEAGRIVDLVSCYELLSFNVGPTLLSWLEDRQPDVYARILAADAATGRAIAQAYGHAILPLCNHRDLRTQVRWGLADFAHRFGRSAVGMWLPETAVSDATLAMLAEEGVRFTILAPTQISATRPLEGGDWVEVGDAALDAARPFRWRHPERTDLGVDLVVYDGSLSHDLAFAGVSSQALVARAMEGRAPGALVVAATDGETFGHHHTFAERGLAYALSVEAGRRGVGTPRIADRLDREPPVAEARVRTSAWSCAHGVDRWAADCGCHTGGEPGWDQAWRAPLRHALDVLRDWSVAVLERRGPQLLGDPWTARDAYIGVLLGARTVEDFAADHVTGDLVDALTLLEAQRHALLMYTSCGWFFNDLAGLETVQILRYAARCIDLHLELGEHPPVDEVLELLATARSNRPEEGDGRAIWERHVLPSRVDPERIVAHLALAELLGTGRERPGELNGADGLGHPGAASGVDADRGAGSDGSGRDGLGDHVAGHLVERGAHLSVDRGGLAVVAGETTLTHRRTRRRTRLVHAAVHLGGLEVFGAVRRLADVEDPRADLEALRAEVERGARVTTLLREVVARFGPREFGLESALPDAAEQIVASAASALVERFAATVEGLHADHGSTFSALASVGYPLPPELRSPVELALTRRFEHELAAAVTDGSPAAFGPAASLAAAARADGVSVGSPRAAALLAQAVERAVAAAAAAPDDDAVALAVELVGLARDLDLGVRVDRAQELTFEALAPAGPDAGDHPLAPLGIALGLAVDHLGAPL
jgi:hypothetical protein